jgi:hypothetical protein
MRIAAFSLLLLVLGCGGADVGEECDDVGTTDECVDGAVCTNEEGEARRCRLLCNEHADCPDGHDCKGVSGTNLKSCQPEK